MSAIVEIGSAAQHTHEAARGGSARVRQPAPQQGVTVGHVRNNGLVARGKRVAQQRERDRLSLGDDGADMHGVVAIACQGEAGEPAVFALGNSRKLVCSREKMRQDRSPRQSGALGIIAAYVLQILHAGGADANADRRRKGLSDAGSCVPTRKPVGVAEAQG